MKQKIFFYINLIILSGHISAAEIDLKVQLPDVELSLIAISPPHLQQEGFPLVTEREFANQLLDLLGQESYIEAKLHMNTRYGELLEILEAGDPEQRIRQMVVVGGLMPSTRRNQISASLLYLMGHTYMQTQEVIPAETAFLNALVPLPDYLRVHESLGLLYLQNERFEDAHKHLTKAASLGLNTGNLYGAIGYLNIKRNNFWGATSAFQQALMLEPELRGWQQSLLFTLSQTNQHQSGLTLVEQMLQLDPDDPELWLFRSQMSMQAEDMETALSSLETAIRLGEDNAANLQVCATLHMNFGSIARAMELLKQGFDQDLDFRYIDQAFSWLEREGEWSYMEVLLDNIRAGQMALNDLEESSLLFRDARLSEQKGQMAEASSFLQQALNLDPSNVGAMMFLGEIYLGSGNHNQAEIMFQRASAYDQYRESALAKLAQLAIDQDNFQRALDLLQQVVALNPSRTELRRNIETLQNLVLLQQDN